MPVLTFDNPNRKRWNMALPDEMSHDQLSSLSQDQLVKRCFDYQMAYSSLINMVNLQRGQLELLQQHSLRSTQIAEIARKVNLSSRQGIEQIAVQDVAALYEATQGLLFLVDRETGLLTLCTSHPTTDPIPPMDINNEQDILLVDVLRHAKAPFVLVEPDQYEGLSGRTIRPHPSDACLEGGAMICPLRHDAGGPEDGLQGLLILRGREGGFARHDADEAVIVVEILAAALNATSLLERMSLLAETDGLTDLYNHRHFQQELDRAMAMAKRYQQQLSLIMLDIDLFKQVNDQHGHQIGDHVLREVARGLRNGLRDHVDIIARYGGEEFAVVLPNTDLEGACAVAERLRRSIEAHPFCFAGHELRVTISLGVACYTGDLDKSTFIAEADDALYRAKHNGRNHVEPAASA